MIYLLTLTYPSLTTLADFFCINIIHTNSCSIDVLQNTVSVLEVRWRKKFLVHASVCLCFLSSFKGNKTHITGIFKNNCQIRKFFLYLFTMLEGKFYMFHRLDLSCQHCLLPPGSELYKHVWKLLYLLP